MIVRLALSLVLAVVGAGIPVGSGVAERVLGTDSATTTDVLRDGIVDGTTAGATTPSVTMADLDAAAARAETVEASDVEATNEAEVTTVDLVLPAVEDGKVVEGQEATAAEADDLVADEVTGERVVTEVLETDGFQTVGVTWPTEVEDAAGKSAPQVRTRAVDGSWSQWTALEPADDAPDPGTPDAENAVRGGTDSLWVGDAEAIQVSFDAEATAGPEGLELALIDVSDVAIDAEPTVAQASWTGTDATFSAVPAVSTLPTAASMSAPRVISRSEWGAASQACTPNTASSLVGVVLHHTAGSNSYSTVSQAKAQIRADQAYHIKSRGWCDIGYNFIVDKWGNIYEGRANSLTKAVVGVHAGGFNTGTLGISMLGTYSSSVPAATKESVAQLAAWRLRSYFVDPTSTMRYTTGNGENSRYKNTTVTLPRIIGHRDVAYTACPGNGGVAALAGIRTRAKTLIGATFVSPSQTAYKVDRGTSVSVKASVSGDISWKLSVTDSRTGSAVTTVSGRSGGSRGSMVATWSGKTTSGAVVGGGTYTLAVTGTDRATGKTVFPISKTVTVNGTPDPPVVAAVPLVGDLRFEPVTPARLVDTRTTHAALGPQSRMDVVVAGVKGVPSTAKAVSVTVTAVNASSVTYVTGWPAGKARPNSSILNADPSRTVPAGVVLGVGGEGKISLYNNAGWTDLLVDVTGYWTASGGGDRYSSLSTAKRVLDTRQDGSISSGRSKRLTLAGKNGIPSDATAVMVNVVSVGAAGGGFVTVVPAGSSTSSTSTVNHVAGSDAANRSLVPLTGGKIDVGVTGARTAVVVDVIGWVGPSGAYAFTPVEPVRAFDTRSSGGALGAGKSRALQVRNSLGSAGSGADLALVTVTATQSTASATFVTLWKNGTTRPATSDLNAVRSRDQANTAIVAWDSSGRVAAYNGQGSTHLIADVYGYFR